MNKQIEEMRRDLVEIFSEEYDKRNLITADNTAEKMLDKGYRKQIEGEWIAKKEMYKAPSTYHYYCSNCEKDAIYDNFMDYARRTNFCPNCGAKMKGGAE